MPVNKLTTPWTVTNKPLQEYPRPQFVRDSYINLNGLWQYAITKSNSLPDTYDGNILVPFSPESALSGVEHVLKPNEFLYYRTTFTVSKSFNKGIVLLHFGAVDQVADVYVNGLHACHHVGGYNSFTVDVTPYLMAENELIVKVVDYTNSKYHTCGKQSLKRGGMWYTPQSGIWQTVWLESVPTQYIMDARITPDFDNASVKIALTTNFDEPVTAVVTDDGVELAVADGKNEITISLPKDFTPWTPENPHLYGLVLVSRRDKVNCYFAMRKFGMENVNGIPRLMLNNKPYFHKGVLDQGYWSDGLYTAPTDDALQYDVALAKKLGFNTIRKHLKVEPLRCYYHCDRLGMLVWQDMPSGGTRQHKLWTLYLPNVGIQLMNDKHHAILSRKSQVSRDAYVNELTQMVNGLYNCPCIAMWVLFNEGWGQFDANEMVRLTKQLDSTRTVDHASGWFDQKGGDVKSMHKYFRPYWFRRDKKRAVVLSEYGGYARKIVEHSFNTDKTYSYRNCTEDSFNADMQTLIRRDVIAHVNKGLCASILTQLTDVEDEVNGLVTYDRKVVKVDERLLKQLNDEIKIEG